MDNLTTSNEIKNCQLTVDEISEMLLIFNSKLSNISDELDEISRMEKPLDYKTRKRKKYLIERKEILNPLHQKLFDIE